MMEILEWDLRSSQQTAMRKKKEKDKDSTQRPEHRGHGEMKNAGPSRLRVNWKPFVPQGEPFVPQGKPALQH